MLFDASPIAITILLSWLLHLIMAFNLKNLSERIHAYYEGLWKILAYVGLTLIVIGLLHVAELLFYGYLFELMAFSAKYLGPWFVWMSCLDVFAPLVFCLNFWPRFRNNKDLRNFQLFLMLVVFSTRLAFGNDFTISIIPGWYATVDFFSFPLTLLIGSALIWWLNHRILKKQKP